MLTGHNIIYFSNDWNADNRTSSHHIAQRLAVDNRLLFVESPGTRAMRASRRDVTRAFTKVSTALRPPRQVSDHVFVATLLLLPLNRYGVVRAINRRVALAPVRRMATRLGFTDPIVWLTTPHVEYVVGRFNEKLSVYYCVDDYSQLPDVDVSALRAMEDRLLAKVDVVFATAEPLVERLKTRHPNVFLAPHGVDVSHFSKALDPQLAVPADIQRIPQPRIGFVGLIERWLDVDVLAAMAVAHPEWSIVLIGRNAVPSATEGLPPNVHFLGPRPYADLPAYEKAFDVAVIPFTINDLTRSVNPLKLYEYLAAGLPVVSSRLPEVEKYAHVVKIAGTRERFVEAVAEALAERGVDGAAARTAAVESLTWERRARAVAETVARQLARRARPSHG